MHATPLVTRNVVVIGAAHRPGGVPRSKTNVKGFIRGFDVRTSKRLWIFHTIPSLGEFGNDTWEKDSWKYTGNAGVWGQMAIDEDLNMAYLPVELPTGDYYGGNRPGANLFGETLVAVDLTTGQRKWHYQFIHHGIWDFDMAAPPILADITVNGRAIKAIAQPTSSRSSTCSIAPTASRSGRSASGRSERRRPGRWCSPTLAFPTKPPVRSARYVDRRSDRLHAGTTGGSVKLVSKYRWVHSSPAGGQQARGRSAH